MGNINTRKKMSMQEKFLESIGASGIDFKNYRTEHLVRILHLSMIIKNTCFWINEAVKPYRTLSTEEQAKILEEYIQGVSGFQCNEAS